MKIQFLSKPLLFLLALVVLGGMLGLTIVARAQTPAPETPAAAPTQAAAPDAPSSLLFSYQGQLLDSGGNPVSGSVPMTFALYTSSTGGTACWTEVHSGSHAVDVQDGLFHVLLGQLTPLDTACLAGDVYLELTVNGETLSPREVMTSVFHAREASTLPDGATTQGELTVNGPLGIDGDITIRDFKTTEVSASGTGDLTIPLGRYRIGNGIQIIAQIEGGWAEGGGVYHISAEWNNNPVVIYRGENSISDRLKFFGYVDPDDSGHAYLFATWDNQSPGESHINIVKLRITGYDFDTSNTGSFSNASLLPSILTIQSVTGNVGIGTTSPSARLEVTGGGTIVNHDTNGTNLLINNTRDVDNSSYAKGGIRLVNGNNPDDWLGIDNNEITAYGSSLNLQVSGATTDVYIGTNLDVHGSVTCGAYIESNLQTPEEKQAESIARFEKGDVLCWAPESEQLEKCTLPNDRLVMAVADPNGKPIVMGAEVIKVLGPVTAGDILVASDVPGYAMVNNNPAPGTVIAQALDDFDGEQGIVKAMIRKW